MPLVVVVRRILLERGRRSRRKTQACWPGSEKRARLRRCGRPTKKAKKARRETDGVRVQTPPASEEGKDTAQTACECRRRLAEAGKDVAQTVGLRRISLGVRGLGQKSDGEEDTGVVQALMI